MIIHGQAMVLIYLTPKYQYVTANWRLDGREHLLSCLSPTEWAGDNY